MPEPLGYVPGSGSALVGEHVTLLLPPGIGVDQVSADELWTAVAHAGDLSQLAERVAAIGLARVGAFVAVHRTVDATRLLLRGNVTVSVRRSGGAPEALVADRAVTWREWTLGPEDTVEVDLSPAAPPPTTAGRGSRPLSGAEETLDWSSVASADEGAASESGGGGPGRFDRLFVARRPPDAPAEARPLDPPVPPVPAGGAGVVPAPVLPTPVTTATAAVAPRARGLIDRVPGVTRERPATTPAPVEAVAGDDLDDEAAMTVRRPARAGDEQAPAGPMVGGLRCPARHPNPPAATTCRDCGAEIVGAAPELLPRPPLGTLVFDDGKRVELDRPAIIGRAPRQEQPSIGEVPQLVTLAGASGEISRSHLEIRFDGWRVLAVDLDSMNGTSLKSAGGASRQLGKREEVELAAGDVVSLADEVSLVYEVPTCPE